MLYIKYCTFTNTHPTQTNHCPFLVTFNELNLPVQRFTRLDWFFFLYLRFVCSCHVLFTATVAGIRRTRTFSDRSRGTRSPLFQRSESGLQRSVSNLHKSGPNFPRSYSGLEKSGLDLQRSGSSLQGSGFGGLVRSRSNLQNYRPSVMRSGSDLGFSGSRFLKLGSRVQKLGSFSGNFWRFQMLAFKKLTESHGLLLFLSIIAVFILNLLDKQFLPPFCCVHCM